MKLDGIRGGGASYPGKPSCPVVEGCRRRQSAEPRRRSRGGEVAEGGRSAGSTDDSGPMKPGNSVEGKTPTIRRGSDSPKPGYLDIVVEIGEVVDERWQWLHGGAEIELRGRDQKTVRGNRISSKRYPRAKAWGLSRCPVRAIRRFSARQSSVCRNHGEAK